MAQQPNIEQRTPSPGTVFQVVSCNRERKATILFENLPDVMDSKTAATALSIPENAIRELARTCEVRGFKVGQTWRFTRQALAEYVDRKEKEAFDLFGGGPDEAA